MIAYLCIGALCLWLGAIIGFFACALLASGRRGEIVAEGLERVTFEHADGTVETYRAREGCKS